MLPRSLRLRTAHVGDVLAKSRLFQGVHISIRASIARDSSPSHTPHRFAVIVSKKVAKTAVLRNRIRRRIYGAIRQTDLFQKEVSPKTTHYAIFAKSSAATVAISSLIDDLNSTFEKSKI